MKKPLIQIVVPVYNEGENIRVLFQNLRDGGIGFDQLKFVYDFDEDTTVPVINELNASDNRVIGERNDVGRGVVNALRFAFRRALPGPVVVVMGDNSDKLTLIPEMIKLWAQGSCVVCPSRYMRGGKQYGGGFVKSSLSRLAGVSLNLLGLPTADPTNNFKLYDGLWLSKQEIQSQGGFEIALELVYKAYRDRRKITELPTEWYDRTVGESRFLLRKWLPHYLRWYFKTVNVLLFTRK